ncbi:Probable E3 ubiquitin-protein ligase RHC1A [Linum grandiflorum]
MSLAAHRPRVVVNGIRRMRTFHYFWCHHCRHTLRFASINPQRMLCPHCFVTLSHELDISRPMLTSRLPEPTRLLESLSLMVDPRVTPYNHPSRNEDQHSMDHWITLHFPPTPPPLQDTTTAANEDRPGPPPASSSAMEALPTVIIGATNIAKDPNCPVCKEEFKMGEEAKEMPCHHLYHSYCIMPWLTMHNTCPVCRYALPIDNCGAELPEPDSNNYDLEELTMNGVNWVRDRVFSMGRRPIRMVSDWALLCMEMLDRRIASLGNTTDDHGATGDQFLFRLILR